MGPGKGQAVVGCRTGVRWLCSYWLWNFFQASVSLSIKWIVGKDRGETGTMHGQGCDEDTGLWELSLGIREWGSQS